MNKIVLLMVFLGALGASASSLSGSGKIAQNASAQSHGIENAREFAGRAENWQDDKTSTASLAVWVQDIRGMNYGLFQIRANLDTYRFSLTHDEVVNLIDALDMYQMAVRQTSGETKSAIGWLYRANINLKRVGESASSDELIVNIQRSNGKRPELVVTFDSWLGKFLGPESSADRAYKSVSFGFERVAELKAHLKMIVPMVDAK